MKKRALTALAAFVLVFCLCLPSFVSCDSGSDGEKNTTGESVKQTEQESGSKDAASEDKETDKVTEGSDPDDTDGETVDTDTTGNDTDGGETESDTEGDTESGSEDDSDGASEENNETTAMTEPEDPYVKDSDELFVYSMNSDFCSYTVRIKNRNVSGEITLPSEHHGLPVTDFGQLTGCDKITKLIIPEGIKTIVNSGFSGWTSLCELQIPGSLVEIDYWTIDSCPSLKYNEYENALYLGNPGNPYLVFIKVKDTATTSCNIHPDTKFIYSNAFKGCYDLYSVEIPEGVIELGGGAFESCRVEKVVLPSTLKRIGDYALSGERLSEVNIPDSVLEIGQNAFNVNYTEVIDNVLYFGDWVVGINFANGPDPSDVVLPSRLVIREGTKGIARGVFERHEEIEEIILPDSLISIGDNAFSYTSISEIKLPDGLKYIGRDAFAYCEKLASVSIPQSVETIGADAFYYCESLESANIPDGITFLNRGIFYGCSKLRSIVIPDSVVVMGDKIFTSCTSLESVTLSKNLVAINDGVFSYCSSLRQINLPEGLRLIGEGAFGISGIEEITIPSSVVRIGEEAFLFTANLERITVAEGNEVYKSAENCLIRLSDKTLILGSKNGVMPSDGSITSIGYAAFSYIEGLEAVVIPEGVTSIDDYAFWNCVDLKSISIPSTVKYFGKSVFHNCHSLAELVIAPENPSYEAKGNCLIDKSTKTLIFGCATAIIPDDGSVTTIGMGAFSGITGMTKLDVPESITKIDANAFYMCSDLREIVIPAGVTRIERYTFYNCTSLEKVVLPDTLEYIGEGAFEGCTSLKEINLPDSIKQIDSFAFSGCVILEEVILPRSLERLGENAFSQCSKLARVTFFEALERIESHAFGRCPSLTEIILPEGVKYLGYAVFYECYGLEKISLPHSLEKMEIPFYACRNLSAVYYNGSVEEWEILRGSSQYTTGEYVVYCNNGESDRGY